MAPPAHVSKLAIAQVSPTLLPYCPRATTKMANILYTWFGWGGLPKAMRPLLEKEGIILLDEGVSGSVGFRKFRAPGRYYSRRRTGTIASLVLTEIRFAVFTFGKPFVNLPLERARLDQIHPPVDEQGRFTVGFDAADFYPDASGKVSGRFATEKARGFLRRLDAVRG
jgi:hypothetical protein